MLESCTAREKQEGNSFISKVIQTSKLRFLLSTLLHFINIEGTSAFPKVPSENGGTEQGQTDHEGQSQIGKICNNLLT